VVVKVEIERIEEVRTKVLKCDFEECLHNKNGECLALQEGQTVRFAYVSWINRREFKGVCLNYQTITSLSFF